MKFKLLIILTALGLIMAVANSTEAVSLQGGGLYWKANNWDVATTYAYRPGLIASVADPDVDLDDRLYFYDDQPDAEAWTATLGHVKYDNTNSDHYLFSGNTNPLDDLVILTDAATYNSILPGEDSWGLFEVVSIYPGVVDPGGYNPVTGQDSIDRVLPAFWTAGVTAPTEYLNGIFYGLDDKVIHMRDYDAVENTYAVSIWSDGLEAKLWEKDSTMNPKNDALPSDRTAEDQFPGWTGALGDEWMILESEYFAFNGIFDAAGLPSGETQVFANVIGGSAANPSLFLDFWVDPFTDPDGEGPSFPYDFFQSWEVGRPFKYDNGWVGSEDSAQGYLVPEPVTMLGVFLGLGSLVGYVRRVR